MEAINPDAYDSAPDVRHPGPPLLVLAIVHVVLMIAGLLVVTLWSGGDRYPSPFASMSDTARFFSLREEQARINAFCVFASAIPLGLFAAVASSRLRYLGVRAAGERIAFYGGVGAALMLLLSGACIWAATGVAALLDSDPALRSLQLLAFVSGGPAMVALFGLLAAGISVSAGMLRWLPSWLVWLGMVVAVLAELSTLTLLIPVFAYLLPVARVLGAIWLIGAGATLPTRRGELLTGVGRGRVGTVPEPAHQPV